MPLRLSFILAAPNKIILADGSIPRLWRAVILSLGEKILISIGFGIASILKSFTSELLLSHPGQPFTAGYKSYVFGAGKQAGFT
jgi:hypothetical protein